MLRSTAFDPESAIKEALANAGIVQKMCREDCEVG